MKLWMPVLCGKKFSVNQRPEPHRQTAGSITAMTDPYDWPEAPGDETFIEFSARPVSQLDSIAEAAGAAPLATERNATQKGPPAVRLPAGLVGVTDATGLPGHEESEEREGWGNKLDFLFSCISVSVGLGNVWRFPYLCYKNGGGAFLVTYGIAMALCGIPLFFQEVAVGQYLGAGGMTLVGQLCPLLQGVGYATMTIVFFLDVYYCVIIAWTLFYLLSSFTALPGLPWQNCENWWNTETCYTPGMNVSHLDMNGSVGHGFRNTTSLHNANHTTTPVEEYWDRRVLMLTDGIHNLGGMQWELLACLILGWGLIYLIIRRGLHQSGKIIWFTALFPYVVLFVLLVRAVTLPGADAGLLYYVTPRWGALLTPGPWIDGATQIFFAYSIGTGALPALGSYNKFHHNCYKDALITCVVNTATCLLAGVVTFSILGHIALEQNSDVGAVVKSGPGLVFLTYPEVVLKLPGAPAWAAIFFVMLVILGIDSEFCIVEAFITGLVDNWPELLRPHRNKFTVCVCLIMLILGIPMVTHGGVYIFQLMDFYSASGMSILWVCFFQTIAISWIFGTGKFCDCVHEMMGMRPNKFWYFCWKIFAPVVMMFIFVFQCVQYKPLTYGGSYEYPWWAEVVGFIMSFSSMVWIPAYAIYYLLTNAGTIKQNFIKGLQPNIRTRNKTPSSTQKSVIMAMSESSAGLISKNNSFLVQ